MAVIPEGLELYHGSYAPISSINLGLCSSGKDFGKGFYLTSSFDQARRVANDTTNPTITAYLNGLFGPVEDAASVDVAIRALMPEKLDNQYCFKSERAISCLEAVGVERYEF